MQDIIAITIALACVLYAIRAARRQFTEGGCGSSGTPCGPADPSRNVKRTPLVTLGLPELKARSQERE